MLEKRAQLSKKFLEKQGMEGEKSFRLVLLQKRGGGVTCFSRDANGKTFPVPSMRTSVWQKCLEWAQRGQFQMEFLTCFIAPVAVCDSPA